MPMEQKIAALTEKIYKEGVEKGEEQKKAIIDSAKSEAVSIIDNARKEAEKIVADAQAQAKEIKRNAESEMKLSSQQAISALKQTIVDTLMAKTVDTSVSSALSDPGIIREMLLAIVKNWQAGGHEVPSLEVLLPAAQKKKLEKSLQDSLKKVIKKGVSLSFSKTLKGGFQISLKDSSFKISLSDEDFVEFFKEYLRPRTRSFLFEE